MNVVTNEQLEQYRKETTGEIEMADGSKWTIRMPQNLWDDLELLKIAEGITEAELGIFALEEQELQGVTFTRAFRGVVAYRANLWNTDPNADG